MYKSVWWWVYTYSSPCVALRITRTVSLDRWCITSITAGGRVVTDSCVAGRWSLYTDTCTRYHSGHGFVEPPPRVTSRSIYVVTVASVASRRRPSSMEGVSPPTTTPTRHPPPAAAERVTRVVTVTSVPVRAVVERTSLVREVAGSNPDTGPLSFVYHHGFFDLSNSSEKRLTLDSNEQRSIY